MMMMHLQEKNLGVGEDILAAFYYPNPSIAALPQTQMLDLEALQDLVVCGLSSRRPHSSEIYYCT